MNRKLITSLGLMAIAAAASQASAQMVYEPFDYGTNSVGTNLDNLTGKPNYAGYVNQLNGQQWFACNTGYNSTTGSENAGTDIKIVSPSLTMPAGLAGSAGNSAQYNIPTSDTVSRTARLALNPFGTTSGTVYYSLAFNVTDMTHLAATASGGFFAGFSDGVGTQSGNTGTVGSRLQLRQTPGDPTHFQVGIKVNTNTNTDGITYQYDTADNFSPGQTIFVVGSYTFNPTSGDDVSNLWVNPNASAFGAGTAPTPTATASFGTDLNSLSSFVLREGNGAEPQGINVDELRVDNSWAQVTMPAGTTWLGGSGNWSTGWSGTTPNSPGAFVNFGGGSAGTVNVDAPETVGTINIQNTNSYTISGNTISLNGGVGGTSAINVFSVNDPGTGGPQAASHTISAPLAMANDTEFNVGVNQTLSVSGAVSGSAALIKNGGGNLVLSGANSYANGTQVNDGILDITSDASLGAAPAAPAVNLTLAAATLRFDAPISINPNRSIQLNGSGIFDTNGNDVTLASQLTPDTINGLTVNGDLYKAGNGVLELTNASNTQNANFIQGGTLRVSNDAELGTAPGAATTNITIGGGALQWGASFDLNNNRTIVIGAAGGTLDTNGNNTSFGGNINAPSTGGGALTKAGDGQFNFAGFGGFVSLILQGGTWNAYSDTNLGASPGAPKQNDIVFNGGTLKIGGGFATSGIAGTRGITVNAAGGNFDTNGQNLTVGMPVVGTGTLTKLNSGTLTVPSLTTGGLTVNGGTVAMTPTDLSTATSTAVSVLGTVSTPGGSFDLANNKLIVTTPGSTGTWDPLAQAYTGVTGQVASARNGGAWNGIGITSSMASTGGSNLYTLGVAKAGDIKQISDSATATFGGQTVHGSDTVVMYTYGGDANLDGKINIDDYGRIDGNVGQSGSVFGWYNGDFNYDGKINIDDYGIIDGNIGLQGAPIPSAAGAVALDGVSAVPEPASLGLLALAGAGLLSRRRQRRDRSN